MFRMCSNLPSLPGYGRMTDTKLLETLLVGIDGQKKVVILTAQRIGETKHVETP